MKTRSLSLIQAVALLLLGSLAPSRAFAGLILDITSDTTSSFAGTFELDSSTSLNGAFSLTVDPATFNALPRKDFGANYLSIYRYWIQGAWIRVESAVPVQAIFETNTAQWGPFNGLSVSGYYTNGGIFGNTTVDWTYSALSDTGGRDGIFSGAFSFVVRSTPVPDSGSTAVIFAFGLLALLGLRRRMGT